MSEDPTSAPGGTPPPEPRRRGRGLKIALAISLSLNLLIVGLIGGAILGRGDPDEAPAIRTLGLGPFALALPREARDDVRRRISEDLPALRAERIEIGRSLRAVQRALLAEPFDPRAVTAALARSRSAAIALQEHGHDALVATLETMSVEERAIMAERLGRAIRTMARRNSVGRD